MPCAVLSVACKRDEERGEAARQGGGAAASSRSSATTRSAESRRGAGAVGRAAQWAALAVVAAAAAGATNSKVFVSSASRWGRRRDPWPFSIHHVRNTGIAFGLFAGSTSIVIVLTTVAIGARDLLRALRASASAAARRGGLIWWSISSLVDRLPLGYVTDFLDFDYWPAFNLADTFIVVGVGILFLSFVAADRSSAAVDSITLSRL